MIDCPVCKEQIDTDSIYCDQCGELLTECPKCKTVRKGKFCTTCAGTKLIPRNGENSIAESKPQVTNSPEKERNDDKTVRSTQRIIGRTLRFSNNSVGINISLNATEQIGRKVGNFKEQFIPHKQISGKHAQINFDPQNGWSVIDFESTNHTYVNGELVGSDPKALQNNDTLTLANIHFNVTIK